MVDLFIEIALRCGLNRYAAWPGGPRIESGRPDVARSRRRRCHRRVLSAIPSAAPDASPAASSTVDGSSSEGGAAKVSALGGLGRASGGALTLGRRGVTAAIS